MENITIPTTSGTTTVGTSGTVWYPTVINTTSPFTVTSIACGSSSTTAYTASTVNATSMVFVVGTGIKIVFPTWWVRSAGEPHSLHFMTLSGIDKMLPHINGSITCEVPVTHALGLLLIKGVTHINIDNNGPIDRIMNKYLGTGDILSAQDELIDAGFIDHARL